MNDTFTITIPVIECRSCGTRTPFGVVVIHAVGHYCDTCAPMVAMLAQRHTSAQIRAGMAPGVIKMPTDCYDPQEHLRKRLVDAKGE